MFQNPNNRFSNNKNQEITINLDLSKQISNPNIQNNIRTKKNISRYSPIKEKNVESIYIKQNKYSEYNTYTPYNNNNEITYNLSERNSNPYHIEEKKIKILFTYNRNTMAYANKNNPLDLNLNLDKPPNFNQQNENINKNIPYKKAKINMNFNNNNNEYINFVDGNYSMFEPNFNINDLSLNQNLNLDNSNIQNSFVLFSPKSQSPAYKKKNLINYNKNNINKDIYNDNTNQNNFRKNNYSLFKERETEIYTIYAKKIQKIFRGYLGRKKFYNTIKIQNNINIINNILNSHLKKNVFEILIKNKNNNNINEINQKPIYRKKATKSSNKIERFSTQKKSSSNERIILKNDSSEVNIHEQLKKYELELSILKEENKQLRTLNHKRFDNIKEISLENQQLKEKNNILSNDLNKSLEKISYLEDNNNENEHNNIKIIKIQNNQDLLNSSFEGSNNINKLKNIHLKQFFWKKEKIYHKSLTKYLKKWINIIENDYKNKELINIRQKILLKYFRNKDNYFFLFMKEEFKKFLFNGIMRENLYLRKEQKKEFLDKIENEEKDDELKKRKLLRFLIFSKIRTVNNILNQQFRKFYFNGLYNHMKKEKDIDIRKSMVIEHNTLNKEKKNDSFIKDNEKDEINEKINYDNINISISFNEDEDIIHINSDEYEKKINIMKKIIFKKIRKDKEFLHKCFIKFYYRGIYRELVYKRNPSSSKTNENTTINNSVIPNSNILNSTIANSNYINNNNIYNSHITNSEMSNHSNLQNSNIIISTIIEDNNEEEKKEEKINREEKVNEIEKDIKKEEIKIEINNEEIEKENLTKRLEKARNLRKILVNKEKEKKETLRSHFYKFYKAGIIRLMRLKGRKLKESKLNSITGSNIINSNIQSNIDGNKMPIVTENTLKSIQLNNNELITLKLEHILYKKNRKINMILRNVLKNWNLKANLFKLRRTHSEIRRRKSSSKNKNISVNKSPESSKNVNGKKKISNKGKDKQKKVNLIPKKNNNNENENKETNIEEFIKKLNKIFLIHKKKFFFNYLKKK